ncbi:MAG: hypothetical protein AAF465_10665 [Pseudomonadota bacterium]
MKLSSCRALKLEIQEKAYSLSSRSASARRYPLARGAGRQRRLSVREPTPIAAVGIAPGKGDEYKLAVRLYQGCERQQKALLKDLDRHMGEIDLVTGIRYQPRTTLTAGGSIGHYRITAGTLGGFVEDADGYYMLSNNHVFANSNQCFHGDPIVAPGPLDAGQATPKIVGLLDRYIPLSKTKVDGVDAALATFSEEVEFFEPWDYSGIGVIDKTPMSDRFAVSRVIKRGRTTGVTRGTVSAFELDGIQLNYGSESDPAIVTFNDQIELVGATRSKAFSAGGDSGSFIIDRDTLKVYALLYGGGPDSQGIDRTVAHFMPDVFRQLGVGLVQ